MIISHFPCGQHKGVMPPVGSNLNDFTWEQISEIAASGQAHEYFAVGDAKEITLNGLVGETNFDNLSVYAFIIGIDHNREIEGSNTIHFQICKSAQTDGQNLCLVDIKYGSSSSDAGYFTMNNSASNNGGWQSSRMRTTLLGNSNTPDSPLTGSLMAALPDDLRAVMKGVTKYTDNTGNNKGHIASNVTATTDYLWLLSAYEVKGVKGDSNENEMSKQNQYAYYANGNSSVFKKHSDMSTSGIWWLRSVAAASSYKFCYVNASGTSSSESASNSYGLAPAFCV